MKVNNTERVPLELLSDAQAELANGLNSLGGRNNDGLRDEFPFYMVVHINRAAEGFLFLKKADRIDASRLLVRPAIEAMIKLSAVNKDASLLYRIAYTERIDDGKWIRPAQKAADFDAEDEKAWQQFTQAYVTKFPNHKLAETRLSLFDAATTAGLDGFYNSHYRLYCKFTHAAFTAVTGVLDHTHYEDNEAVMACTLCGLETIRALGGDVPNLKSLFDRLSEACGVT